MALQDDMALACVHLAPTPSFPVHFQVFIIRHFFSSDPKTGRLGL